MTIPQALRIGITDANTLNNLNLSEATMDRVIENQLKQLAKVNKDDPKSILDTLAITPDTKSK